jgi:hypothetical protein
MCMYVCVCDNTLCEREGGRHHVNVEIGDILFDSLPFSSGVVFLPDGATLGICFSMVGTYRVPSDRGAAIVCRY